MSLINVIQLIKIQCYNQKYNTYTGIHNCKKTSKLFLEKLCNVIKFNYDAEC